MIENILNFLGQNLLGILVIIGIGYLIIKYLENKKKQSLNTGATKNDSPKKTEKTDSKNEGKTEGATE